MTKKLVDNKIAPNKAEYDKKFSHVLGVTPYHGAVTLPKTMALVCEELKLLKDSSQKNEMEGGKKTFLVMLIFLMML